MRVRVQAGAGEVAAAQGVDQRVLVDDASPRDHHEERARPEESELVRAQEVMTRAARAKDFAEQVQADIRFHWSLVQGLGSERLSRMYEMVSGEIHLTMGQYSAHRRTSPSNVVAEHQAIMAAIEAGDEDAARTELTEHLAHARDRVLAEIVEDEPELSPSRR